MTYVAAPANQTPPVADLPLPCFFLASRSPLWNATTEPELDTSIGFVSPRSPSSHEHDACWCAAASSSGVVPRLSSRRRVRCSRGRSASEPTVVLAAATNGRDWGIDSPPPLGFGRRSAGYHATSSDDGASCDDGRSTRNAAPFDAATASDQRCSHDTEYRLAAGSPGSPGDVDARSPSAAVTTSPCAHADAPFDAGACSCTGACARPSDRTRARAKSCSTWACSIPASRSTRNAFTCSASSPSCSSRTGAALAA